MENRSLWAEMAVALTGMDCTAMAKWLAMASLTQPQGQAMQRANTYWTHAAEEQQVAVWAWLGWDCGDPAGGEKPAEIHPAVLADFKAVSEWMDTLAAM